MCAYVIVMDKIKSANTAWWRRKKVVWAGAAALLLLGIGSATAMMGKASPAVERTSLWVDTAVKGEMRREIRANGILVPRQIRWITAGAPASVQETLVDPGAMVKADSIILRLANPELASKLQRAQAALNGADAEVAAARTSLASQLLDQRAAHVQADSEWRIADIKLRANKRALDAGVISNIEFRQSEITEQQTGARASLEAQRVESFKSNMQAQLRAAQARRDELESELALVSQQLDSLEVRAGIDGILQQVDVEPGQQVELGAKLARVARPDELIARLQVAELLAKDLRLGLPATIDTRNGIAKGRVVRIDPAVRNATVTVDVAMDGAMPAGARPDLSVDGRILLGTLPNVVSIGRPASAVPGAESTLFVIRAGESTALRTPVRFGAVSSDRVEVVQGLAPGDQAVLSDASQWSDHDSLRLR
ncbi:HlyD family efflux transporter periplasmic adaptor subunit [Stenotrophomonas sp. G106K1]|uniref:efflux RND transporter periplasmic adaptor subunit n=1 Tax=Stenotrophomonas sp. G106K1 TaxID=3134792 RepID=UPI0030F43AD5